MKKRLLSILLVASMVVALVPALIVSTSALSTDYKNGDLLLQMDSLSAGSVTYNPYGIKLGNGTAVASKFGTDTTQILSTNAETHGGVGLTTDLPLSAGRSYTIEYYAKLLDNNGMGVFMGLGQNNSWCHYGMGLVVLGTGDKVETHCKWWNNIYYKKGTTDRWGRGLGSNVWQTKADEDGFVKFTFTFDGKYMGMAVDGVDIGVKWDTSAKATTDDTVVSSAFKLSTLTIEAGYTNVSSTGVTAPAANQAICAIKNISVYAGVSNPEWEADEITINTADQFVEFSRQLYTGRRFEGQTVKLGADIDLSGKTITAGGHNSKNSANGFYGTFDGQFHTISNLTSPATLANGMFGSLKGDADTHAQIKNLAIVNYKANGNRLGTLYGYVNAKLTVENVYINATFNGNNGDKKEYQGGFIANVVGIGEVTFRNCVFDGKVYASGYGASSFVGCINHEAGGSGQVAKTTKPIIFENCLATGGFYNGTAVHEGGVRFFGSNWSTVNEGQVSYTNCIRYTDYYQTGAGAETPLCPGLGYIGAGLTAVTPEGYTARNSSYPVPTTLLPFFDGKINEAHTSQAGAADLTVEYSKAQERVEEDGTLSVRLIGAVNVANAEELKNYKAVGFEVVAIRNENAALWNNGATQVHDVYTGYLNGDETVSAEAAGGDYVFMYALEGIQANKGIVTFAIKTFYVDAEGTTVYTDMYVLDYNTNK